MSGANKYRHLARTTRRKRLAYRVQGVFVLLVFWLFRKLPVDFSSGLMGWVGRRLGPRLGKSRRAVAGLTRVFPDMERGEIDRIVRDMWDNLFRTAIEFVHLAEILATENNERVEIVGEEKFRTAREAGVPVLIVSGHLANWEIAALPMLRWGGPTGIVYRRSNNPSVDRLIAKSRGAQSYTMLPKGREGAKGLLALLRNNGQVAMLVDQKFNRGISAPFMGRPALTSTSAAEMAYKYGVVLIPARPERLDGCRFRLTLFDPIPCDPTADHAAEVEKVTRTINDRLSEWIEDRPAQWMWLHRRWPDSPD